MSDPMPPWARYFPKSPGLAMLETALFAGASGLATVALGVYVFRDYGVALFCGVPIVMGVLAPLLYGMGARRPFWELLAASLAAQVVLLGSMIVFAIEGIFCLMMAAPLWILFVLMGTAIAWPIHVAMWKGYYIEPRGFPVLGLAILLAAPLWMGAEHVAQPEAPLLMVSTVQDVDAPPEVVWRRVVAFPDMPPPGWENGGWMFHLGIARPIRAELEGSGVGATRYCVFSTGKASEPVRTWEQNRLLEVDVTDTPPSMEETSIYPHLHPAHLEGYMVSAKARFELVPLAGGRTRIIGTSWYRNRMFPVAYWRWWSDGAIKAVQVNVLAHIAGLSERDARERSIPCR